MRKKQIAILLFLVLISIPAFAAKFEQFNVTSTPAVGFTAAKIVDLGASHPQAQQAFCTLMTAPINYTVDGTTPTAALGHTMQVGDKLTVTGYTDIANFKAIAISTTGVLNCSYFFDVPPTISR